MKRVKRLIAASLGLTSSILMSGLVSGLAGQEAKAAGFIVVDPAFHGAINVGVPRVIAPIPRPGTPRPPVGRTPVLKGGVSLGLHLQDQDIRVEISDQVAKTYITQTFVNDTDQNLAGTYLFPLPEDTTFSSFSLHIDGKPVEGKILEANEARTTYEQIVRQMVDPGLLEYADYKTVRARIFPIPARGTKKVELEYTQLLKAENGLVKYRFPLKTDKEAAAGAVDNTKIAVKLNGKQGLRTIWSPSHTVKTDRPENNKAKVSFDEKNAVQDKDFLLYYSLSDKDVAANLITHKVDGEDGYFLLSLAPPLKAAATQAKDIVLVADTSGSMQGEKMEQAKKALKYVVTALGANDRLGIVPFNTDADSFRGTLVQATTDNKRLAVDYIDELEPRGGTNIGDALKTGASLLKDSGEKPAYLVMMTDGEPTVGETSMGGLVKLVSNKNIRLFDFGVGYDVNTRLLNKLSSDHHGTSQYLEPGESLEVALSAFYEKIKAPMLSDVSITYNGVTVKDIYPREVKDIFAGNQLLLLGRYKGSGQGTVNIAGKMSGIPKSFSFPVSYAASEAGSSHLSRLWAMRRIGYLTQVAQENGDTKEVVDEIIALSKKHGIISNYTSFLVTDPSEIHRLANGAVPIARPMEEGVVGSRRRASGLVPPRPMLMAQRSAANRFSFAGGGGSVTSPAPRSMPFGADAMAADSVSESKSVRIAGAGVGGALGTMGFFGGDKKDTGRQAILREKAAAKMKEETHVAKDDSAVKTIEGKTFVLNGEGYWVDTEYKGGAVTHIKFGSNEYFELARKSTQVTKYLACGKQMILVTGGKAYKVAP